MNTVIYSYPSLPKPDTKKTPAPKATVTVRVQFASKTNKIRRR